MAYDLNSGLSLCGITEDEGTDSSYTVRIEGKVYFDTASDDEGGRYLKITAAECTPTVLDSSFTLTRLKIKMEQFAKHGLYSEGVDETIEGTYYHVVSGSPVAMNSYFSEYAFTFGDLYQASGQFALSFERRDGGYSPSTYTFQIPVT